MTPAEAAICEKLRVRIEDRGGHSAVAQRTRTDCGIAVLAWLLGVSWSTARDAIFGFEKAGGSYRTKLTDVVTGLAILKWVAGPLSRVRSWHRLPAGEGFASVFVGNPVSARRARHWVAWHKTTELSPVVIFDPEKGLVYPASTAARIHLLTLRSHFAITRAS